MKRIVFAILIAAALLGCSHHPADIVAPVLITTNQVYDVANKSMIALYDTCKAAGEQCPAAIKPIVTNWNKIDDVCDKIDAALKTLDDTWITLSQAETPENQEQFNKQLALVKELLAELRALIPGLNISMLHLPPQTELELTAAGGK